MSTSEKSIPDRQTGLRYLNGNWIDRCSNFKTSLFKHHDGCVVDTRSYGRQKDREVKGDRVVPVLSKPPYKKATHSSQLRGHAAVRHYCLVLDDRKPNRKLAWIQ